MKRQGRKKEWSVVLFCAALLLFMPPILPIFDKPDLIFGLPITFVVLFGTWAVVIFFVAVGARQKKSPTQINKDANADGES
ncbi:MAG: hypothetical protein COB59_12245 [Rhodospirillaceae bacterium]|nr:MAG: hypothetical protein COB59_12245 [Rhodospirillaceae bacterium]